MSEASNTTNINSSPNPVNTGVLQSPRTFLQTKTHFHHESSSSIPPNQIREIKNPIANNDPNHDKPVPFVDNFVYISNPIYSNEATSKPTTPFETPQSSPSRLETTDSDEEDNDITEEDSTLTLTPMKDLPEKACSVSLKHVKSLETYGSESNSNNNNGGSSSSSCSLYTSPSW